MGFNIKTLWKIHLRGFGWLDRSNGQTRNKYRVALKAHSSRMKEQDLDHLGALHEKVIHSAKN